VALAAKTGECLAHGRLRVPGAGADRLIGIATGLTEWLSYVERDGQRIVHVCMEQYAFSATGQGLTAIHEAGGTIKVTLVHHLGRPIGFPSFAATSQVKKFGTGKGTAPKDQVSTFVLKKWGEHMPNNDEADAYVLAQIARSIVNRQTEHSYEQDVIDKMRKTSAIHGELPDEEKYELDVWG
jgi:Holliday junction resolvasome RuvABC endonuclease subunit